jgi:hypothetical protein
MAWALDCEMGWKVNSRKSAAFAVLGLCLGLGLYDDFYGMYPLDLRLVTKGFSSSLTIFLASVDLRIYDVITGGAFFSKDISYRSLSNTRLIA